MTQPIAIPKVIKSISVPAFTVELPKSPEVLRFLDHWKKEISKAPCFSYHYPLEFMTNVLLDFEKEVFILDSPETLHQKVEKRKDKMLKNYRDQVLGDARDYEQFEKLMNKIILAIQEFIFIYNSKSKFEQKNVLAENNMFSLGQKEDSETLLLYLESEADQLSLGHIWTPR